jgi:hypothetical protein
MEIKVTKEEDWKGQIKDKRRDNGDQQLPEAN